jgi:hypothetical protein
MFALRDLHKVQTPKRRLNTNNETLYEENVLLQHSSLLRSLVKNMKQLGETALVSQPASSQIPSIDMSMDLRWQYVF